MVAPGVIRAVAPAKLILIGEHAVNRGQAALAVSVGRYASCTVTVDERHAGAIQLRAGAQAATTSNTELLAFAAVADELLAAGEASAIRRLLHEDWWAPVKYVLAGFGGALPGGLAVAWESRIPATGGLGSGAACFVALVAALNRLLGEQQSSYELAALARRGDIIAHGGIASGLDTSTSLFGGAIRFSVAGEAVPIPVGADLQIVIGDSGVHAPTAAVNGRVRAWLNERPSRMHYFHEIGTVSRLAEPALGAGDWETLGSLINLNQLLLERIGVSSPELERLNEAALEAGAYGAKLSGSGGGGIMFALVAGERVADVSRAIGDAGGAAIAAPVAVPGVQVSNLVTVDSVS